MKFSVITINYNNANGLRRTIESVVAQTYMGYEYFVIDGGSTDGSVEVIKEYTNKINYWLSESDNGIYHAMNKGIAAAKGEYCNFLNSGDVFYDKDVLQKVQSYGKTEDVVCGDIVYPGQGRWTNPDKLTMKRFYKNSLFHQASFIRTSLLKEKPYDETMKIAADWKWFIETLIFQNASYVHIPEIIVNYEGGGISEAGTLLGKKERKDTLQSFLPVRVLEDYQDYVYGVSPYRRLFATVEDIKWMTSLIYTSNVCILKLLNLKIRARWIKELPWVI